jgi:hypothetical protein
MTGRRELRTGALVLAVLAAAVVPARAQVVQSLQIGVGGFFPRGFDTRANGDTLVANLIAEQPLEFEIRDFRTGHIFGEWNVAFGPHVEIGAGLGYYGKRVSSFYSNLVNQDAGNADIPQDLRLRVVPITAVVRFLPFGDFGSVQPYVGGGVAALHYRYSEVGQFVDLSDDTIFNGRFVTTGTTPGGILLAGLRAPINGDVFGFTLEWRYQFGTGDTGGINAGFLGEKIDLSGGFLNFGMLVRF